MKKKIFIATLLFSIALVKTIDWMLFWNKNEDLAFINYEAYLLKYSEQYPYLIRPLFETRPEIASIISALFYLFAAYLFWNKNKKILIILSVISSFLGVYSFLSAIIIKY